MNTLQSAAVLIITDLKLRKLKFACDFEIDDFIRERKSQDLGWYD